MERKMDQHAADIQRSINAQARSAERMAESVERLEVSVSRIASAISSIRPPDKVTLLPGNGQTVKIMAMSVLVLTVVVLVANVGAEFASKLLGLIR
jgi:hypothetical protein